MTLFHKIMEKTNTHMIPIDIHTHHTENTENAVVNTNLPIKHTDAKGYFSEYASIKGD